MVIAALIEQRLVRLSPRIPLVLGPLVALVGLVWLARIEADWSYLALVAPPLLIIGAGLVAAYIASTTATMAGADDSVAGIVSAVLNAAQQVGAAIGAALLSTVAVEITDRSSAGAVPTPTDLVDGFQAALLGAAGFMLLAIPVAWILLRGVQPARVAAPVTTAPQVLPARPADAGSLRSVSIAADPVVTEHVSTRLATRRTASGAVMTAEIVTIIRTTTETIVNQTLTTRREPGAPSHRATRPGRPTTATEF